MYVLYTCTGKAYSLLNLCCIQKSCIPLEFDRLADRDCSYSCHLGQGGGIPQFSHPRANYIISRFKYLSKKWFKSVKRRIQISQLIFIHLKRKNVIFLYKYTILIICKFQ